MDPTAPPPGNYGPQGPYGPPPSVPPGQYGAPPGQYGAPPGQYGPPPAQYPPPQPAYYGQPQRYGQPPQPPPPAPVKPKRARRWLVAIIGGLSALGVLGAVGSYYVPGLLDRLGANVTDRHPIDYDVVGSRVVAPNFVFPDALSPADVPSDLLAGLGTRDADFADWARSHGGVIADEDQIRVVIRGRSDAIVHLDDVRVRVVTRAAPRSGWVNLWDGCGAGVEPRVVSFDADSGDPPQWYINDEPADRPAFTVTSSDQETFDIRLKTTKEEISWVIEVEYSSAERDGVLTIDDDGRPFTLTSASAAEGFGVPNGGSALRPDPTWNPDSPETTRPPC